MVVFHRCVYFLLTPFHAYTNRPVCQLTITRLQQTMEVRTNVKKIQRKKSSEKTPEYKLQLFNHYCMSSIVDVMDESNCVHNVQNVGQSIVKC